MVTPATTRRLTGVKMGAQRPLTSAPSRWADLKEIVLAALGKFQPGGSLTHVTGVPERYVADIVRPRGGEAAAEE